MSAIFDFIRAQVGALAVVHFDEGQLFKSSRSYSAGGDVALTWGAPFPIRCHYATLTEAARAAVEYTEHDAALIFTSPEAVPDSGDEVEFDGRRFRLMSPIVRDPAGAGWTARGTPV